MNRRRSLVTALLLALALAPAARAQKELKPGDAAPGLQVEAWVLGSELSIEEGTVYVIMFFESATSSGHTTAETFRTLERLQELYELNAGRGVVMVLVAPENAERLADSIKSRPQMVGFNVAADRRGTTRRAWVEAAGVTSFPTAFIVGRDRRVMHIAGPREEGFAWILEQVIAGRWDPQLRDKAEPVLEAARRARKVKNWRMAEQQYDQVIDLKPQIFADVALEKFKMLVAREEMADREAAYTYAAALAQGPYKDDADLLRRMAARIATDPDIDDESRDLEFAERVASAARKLTGDGDPESLATMALVRFHQERVKDAVELQRQAYFVAHPRLKPRYRRDLETYQAALQKQSSR